MRKSKVMGKIFTLPVQKTKPLVVVLYSMRPVGPTNREKTPGQTQTLQRQSIRVRDTCGTDQIQPYTGGDYTQRVPRNHA